VSCPNIQLMVLIVGVTWMLGAAYLLGCSNTNHAWFLQFWSHESRISLPIQPILEGKDCTVTRSHTSSSHGLVVVTFAFCALSHLHLLLSTLYSSLFFLGAEFVTLWCSPIFLGNEELVLSPDTEEATCEDKSSVKLSSDATQLHSCCC
jgi:hypothetical protein